MAIYDLSGAPEDAGYMQMLRDPRLRGMLGQKFASTYGAPHAPAIEALYGDLDLASQSPEVQQRVADIQAGLYEPADKWYESPWAGAAMFMAPWAINTLAGLGAAAGAEGAAAAGSASAGGTAAGAAGGAGASLGSGLSLGSTASGIGGGAMGSGITPGVASMGIGGGALGTGIGATAGSLGAIGGAGLGLGALGAGTAASGLGSASTGATAATTAATGGTALDKIMGNPSLIGAGLGALAGGLGGSEQAGTTTTVTDVPEWMKPYWQGMLGQATDKFNQMPKTSTVMGAAQNEYLKTVKGDYLDPASNPWLSKTFDMGAGRIKSQLSPSFGHMQAFGSNSGYNQALGRSLGDFATNLYGQNYQNERGRQFQATGQAPTFTTGGYEAAFAPFSQYKNLLNTGGSQTTSPYFENKLGSMLGGAMTGYGMGRMFS